MRNFITYLQTYNFDYKEKKKTSIFYITYTDKIISNKLNLVKILFFFLKGL